MIRGPLLVTIIFVQILFLGNLSARAQVTCVQTYFTTNVVAESDLTSTATAIVKSIANSIGLDANGIRVIPCDGIDKASSNFLDSGNVPKGEYIFYDPVWVREVVGRRFNENRKYYDQLIVLFGHELGHLLNRHYTVNSSLPRIQQETVADQFAGCAAGALGASWTNVEEFLERVRGDLDTTYPRREKSLAAAKSGFSRCQHAVDESYRVRTDISAENFLRVNVGDRVFFGDDSSEIDSSGMDTIRRVSEFLKANPMLVMSIEGHDAIVDENGKIISQESALILSELRASAAKKALVREGIDPARLLVFSYGNQRLSDPASTPEASALNRRVIFEVIPEVNGPSP